MRCDRCDADLERRRVIAVRRPEDARDNGFFATFCEPCGVRYRPPPVPPATQGPYR